MAVATQVPSLSPAAPGASTWFGTGRRRDETPGQRGAGRSQRSPPRLRARLGAAPARGHAAIGPHRNRAVPCRAAIGPRWGWAVSGPRRHWAALELGSARAPATARHGRERVVGHPASQGSAACLLQHLRGVAPGVGGRGGGELVLSPTTYPLFNFTTYGNP